MPMIIVCIAVCSFILFYVTRFAVFLFTSGYSPGLPDSQSIYRTKRFVNTSFQDSLPNFCAHTAKSNASAFL